MPVAVDRNAAIMKIPGTMNLGGIIASPRFAVDDTPPIAPATEEKAPAKKTTAKKTTTKKTTAKKSTAKKEIKVSAFVEYYGKQVEEKEIIARVK